MRRKLIKYLAGVACLLLAAGVGITTAVKAENKNNAGATLESYMPKNKSVELGTPENPFTILEIVPNKSMGMIGYMIPGCEPVDMDAVMQDEGLKGDVPVDFLNPGLFTLNAETGEWKNNDVFVQGCFGKQTMEDGFVSQVITTTPDKLTDDKLGIIDEADLIVFTQQDYCVKYWEKHNWKKESLSEAEKKKTAFLGPDGNDISWNTALRIVNRMASDNPAAMILQSSNMYEQQEAFGYYNTQKLYIMLMQYGAKPFRDTFIADSENFKAEEITANGRTYISGVYRNPFNGNGSFSAAWNNETFMTEFGVSVMHESKFLPGPTGEVFGKILTFNGNMAFLRTFLAKEIGEIPYTSTEYDKSGANSEMFDYFQDKDGKRPDTLSMQQGAEYILSGGREDGYKKKLHVLEVQPCNRFIYGSTGWKLYYASMFPWFTGDLEKDLTVTTMPTYELIGDNTDLNAAYDLILIGDKQDASNGGAKKADGMRLGYNDWEMQKAQWDAGTSWIYSSLGDLVNKPLGQWEDKNWSYAGRQTAWSDRGSDAYQMKARYAGNDLTKKKYEELRDYLAAGNPVVVGKKLYVTGAKIINKELVDEDSYLYRLGSKVYGAGSSQMLFKEGEYRDATGYDMLKSALSKEKCEIVFSQDANGSFTGYPTVYEKADGKEATYNGMKNEAGKPLLCFAFSVEGNKDSRYGVKLFVDRNYDGIYDGSIKEGRELAAAGSQIVRNSEEVAGPDIRDEAGNAVANGELMAGTKYVVTYTAQGADGRALSGILPWKLEVYDCGNDSIRSTEVNYTAVKPSVDERVELCVLQMNLMPDMRENAPTTSVNFADTATEAGKKFDAYLKQVDDYKVDYTFLENQVWYDAYGLNGSFAQNMGTADEKEKKEALIFKWKKTLEDMDILVLGYSDMAAFTGDEIFYEGLREFLKTGKGLILSHDVVEDATLQYRADHLVTPYAGELRTIAGQRRKYYLTTDDADGRRNYYCYSRAPRTKTSGVELAPYGKNKIEIWTGEEAAKTSIADGYYSKVPTNIPSGIGNFTIPEAGTYQDGENTCCCDMASEMMDNSVRLLKGYTADNDRKDRVVSETALAGDIQTTWIRLANKGQITTYPFTLGDTIKVSKTHAQSFQLDLEQADDGDVTVWYNLTDNADAAVQAGGANDGLYSSRPQDARNQYYLYTKGAVTYTGLGHSGTPTDDEIKLFINTLIGAYRPVPGKPYLRVTNEDAIEQEDIYTLYLMITGAEREGDLFPVEFEVVEDEPVPGMLRSYALQYQNENGQALDTQVETAAVSEGALLKKDDAKKCYAVSLGGTYRFEVPYQDIMEKGKVEYYLELKSSYMRGKDVIETQKVTKVVIYAMNLFPLA